jgi:hypothetical protein
MHHSADNVDCRIRLFQCIKSRAPPGRRRVSSLRWGPHRAPSSTVDVFGGSDRADHVAGFVDLARIAEGMPQAAPRIATRRRSAWLALSAAGSCAGLAVRTTLLTSVVGARLDHFNLLGLIRDVMLDGLAAFWLR